MVGCALLLCDKTLPGCGSRMQIQNLDAEYKGSIYSPCPVTAHWQNDPVELTLVLWPHSHQLCTAHLDKIPKFLFWNLGNVLLSDDH